MREKSSEERGAVVADIMRLLEEKVIEPYAGEGYVMGLRNGDYVMSMSDRNEQVGIACSTHASCGVCPAVTAGLPTGQLLALFTSC